MRNQPGGCVIFQKELDNQGWLADEGGSAVGKPCCAGNTFRNWSNARQGIDQLAPELDAGSFVIKRDGA